MYSYKSVAVLLAAALQFHSRQRLRTLEQPSALLEDISACNRLSLQLTETVAAGIRIGTPRSRSCLDSMLKMCRKWTSLLYLPRTSFKFWCKALQMCPMQQTIEPSHLRIFEATLYWDGLIDSSRDDQVLRFPAWNSPKHLQDLEIKINAVQLMAARF